MRKEGLYGSLPIISWIFVSNAYREVKLLKVEFSIRTWAGLDCAYDDLFMLNEILVNSITCDDYN